MEDDRAIVSRGLGMAFGGAKAVSNLDLSVKRGELFGLVGPDGAGKTTTMRLLSGIMEPTEGEAWVAGFSIISESESIKERIGYMPQRFGLYEDLTVMENLHFYAALYDVPRRERGGRMDRLLSFSNLTPFKKRMAGALSGGMKQKLGLACALIHTPEILLLDEPTNGVDPVSRRDFWRILYGLLREGITIFVTTAYLDEAERCARVGFMNRGSLMVTDDPQRIKTSLPLPMMEITTPDSRKAEAVAGNFPGLRGVNRYGDRLHIVIEGGAETLAALIRRLEEEGVSVEETREITPSLEDIFISMVKE